MIEQLTTILDALADIKLLPRRAFETDVLYGYVLPNQLETVVSSVARALSEHGYEVHECQWENEAVLLAINNPPQPLAMRLTASSSERYSLYSMSRPRNAQMLWQWAQGMMRQRVRQRRKHRR